MTTLDGTGLEEEATIIHWAASKAIPLPVAEGMELWELAAACGVHLKETRADHDEREIVQKKVEYWEETAPQRADTLTGYTERRKARALERREAKRRKVT